MRLSMLLPAGQFLLVPSSIACADELASGNGRIQRLSPSHVVYMRYSFLLALRSM
jgi:hypothetical protein